MFYYVFDTSVDSRVSPVTATKLTVLHWINSIREEVAEAGDYTGGLCIRDDSQDEVPYPMCDPVTGMWAD